MSTERREPAETGSPTPRMREAPLVAAPAVRRWRWLVPRTPMVAARATSSIRQRGRRHGCRERKHGAQERTETLRLCHWGSPSLPQVPAQQTPELERADKAMFPPRTAPVNRRIPLTALSQRSTTTPLTRGHARRGRWRYSTMAPRSSVHRPRSRSLGLFRLLTTTPAAEKRGAPGGVRLPGRRSPGSPPGGRGRRTPSTSVAKGRRTGPAGPAQSRRSPATSLPSPTRKIQNEQAS
jgi:hypothetical protein